jgi:hypothetical protein
MAWADQLWERAMVKRILLADDQVPDPNLRTREDVREFYKRRFGDPRFAEGFVFLFDLLVELRDNAYQVTAVNNIKGIDAAVEAGEFDAIVLDLGWWTDETMPYDERMSKGWELAEGLKKRNPVPIVMFSNRFPEKNGLAETAAEAGLLPCFKSYDPNCIKNLLVTLKYITTARPLVHSAKNVFIGHGHSPLWQELRDYLEGTLHLKWDEFNRRPVAGITTVDRLKEMLDSARFALLVMTAEDEHGEDGVHARENVVHEVGLFQGRLGFNKTVLLIEDTCGQFSNISGLSYISFPAGQIQGTFKEIRRVLQREGICC